MLKEAATEDGGLRGDSSAALSLPLRVLMEWEGERGSGRTGVNTLLFLFLLDAPEAAAAEVRVPGRVTDSNILECASLGVKRGARSSGLLLCTSNLVPGCSGAKRRAEAAGPGAGKPGAKPTSSGVSGGGRKLSKMGLRMRPSLAYFAEEKYCGSARECFSDVHRKVGSRRMDLRLPCRAAGAGRKGEASGMVGGRSQGVWSGRPGAGCSGGGGLRSGGGGEAEACCWGAPCRADSFLVALDPKLLSDTEYLLPRRSLPSVSAACDTGSGAWASGGSPCSSGSPRISSEACESVEVSTLGLLEREESEDACEERCEAALDFSDDPQDAAPKRLLGVDSRRAILIGGS